MHFALRRTVVRAGCQVIGSTLTRRTHPLPRRTLLLLCGGVLVLLIFRDQVVHVALSFGELHLVHALSCVPVQESLTPEHGSEVLRHSLEHLLDGGRVPGEGDGHLEPLGWNIADGALDVVRDPFYEVG